MLRHSTSCLKTIAVRAGARGVRNFRTTLLAQRGRDGLLTTPMRTFSSSSRAMELTKSVLTTEQYHKTADETMDNLLLSLEEIVEAPGTPIDWEVDYSTSTCGKSGVLTLKLGDHGTYVVNKQPPNMQIWLSSPTSGPKRYDHSQDNGGVWYYARDGRSLRNLLEEEISQVLGAPVELPGV